MVNFMLCVLEGGRGRQTQTEREEQLCKCNSDQVINSFSSMGATHVPLPITNPSALGITMVLSFMVATLSLFFIVLLLPKYVPRNYMILFYSSSNNTFLRGDPHATIFVL